MMKQWNSGWRRFREGNAFTTLEIMIVVMVFGVIVVMAVPAIRKSLRDAQIREAKADLAMLSTAVLQLAWDTGMWPKCLPRNKNNNPETWDLTTPEAGILLTSGCFSGWKGPYMRTLDTDPWGNHYFFDPDYWYQGKNRVVVGSFGPNGIGPNVYDWDNIIVLLD